jgi:hypothetical protein
MSHRKMLLKILFKKGYVKREQYMEQCKTSAWTKMFCFQQKRKWRILCLVQWITGSLTAVDILCDKCILLKRMVIYKTFAKYVSKEKYYQKFCKKKSSVMLKNSYKLLNKFTAGQKCLVFNRRECE